MHQRRGVSLEKWMRSRAPSAKPERPVNSTPARRIYTHACRNSKIRKRRRRLKKCSRRYAYESSSRSRTAREQGESHMKLGLEGKIVLVTGGSKGIGLACAQAFAGEGAHVAIASRAQENLERARLKLAQSGVEVVAKRADFSKPEEANAAVVDTEKLLGPIDVLINCAGAANRYQVDAYNTEAWHQGLNSKFFPQVHAMDAVRPGMIQRKRGAIINIIGMGGKSAQQVFLSGGAANAALMLVPVGW